MTSSVVWMDDGVLMVNKLSKALGDVSRSSRSSSRAGHPRDSAPSNIRVAVVVVVVTPRRGDAVARP